MEAVFITHLVQFPWKKKDMDFELEMCVLETVQNVRLREDNL